VKVFVKICGMNDARAVDAALAAGADAVGFVFAKSPRQVTVEHARAISAGVPKNVLRVAVMLHPDDDAWREVLDVFRPDVLQTDAADFDYLDVPSRIRRWPVVREGEPCDKPLQEFVYEGQKSGRGETVNWQHAAPLASRGRMILAGGLNAANVGEAIRIVNPFGVDTSSAVESVPGKIDPDKICAFINAVRAAETGLGKHEVLN
jgi:phosphoribosylanthranilate isomerase